jgi:hypothetical protein
MFTSWLASDILVSSILPLLILVIGIRLLPSFSLRDLHDLLTLSESNRSNPYPHFSLPRAAQTYSRYAELAKTDIARMRVKYATLGRAHRRIGTKIGYAKKLDRLEEVTGKNTAVTSAIARLAKEDFPIELGGVRVANSTGDLGRVREALKHFVRDWSEEGKEERERIFAPILDVLGSVGGDERRDKKVLVPGSGLGRLAWEISQLGVYFIGCRMKLLIFL